MYNCFQPFFNNIDKHLFCRDSVYCGTKKCIFLLAGFFVLQMLQQDSPLVENMILASKEVSQNFQKEVSQNFQKEVSQNFQYSRAAIL
jgi:hypothetical protein